MLGNNQAFSGLSIAALFFAHARAVHIPQTQLTDVYGVGSQEDIFPYLGGAGPYFSFPGDYGIPVDIPAQCELSQIQLLARHGERYPTKSRGKKLLKLWKTFDQYSKKFNGSLSFLNDGYEFFLKDPSNLEMETTLENSVNAINPYTGEMDAKLHAQQFLAQYKEFLEDNNEFAVFAASSQRVHDTARYFIDSLGTSFNISLQVVSEEPSAGANTLSAGYSCPAWNSEEHEDIINSYSTEYLDDIAARLSQENKGLNLTQSDALLLFSWCAYELNARGYSEICNVFTKEDLLRYSYQDDLTAYYQDGPGYPMIQAVGANYFNASLKLMKESEKLSQKVWLS